MTNEAEKIEEPVENVKEQVKRQRRKNKVSSEIIDDVKVSDEFIAKLKEEITKQVLESINKVGKEESQRLFEPTNKKTKQEKVNRIISVPRTGKSRIRSINIQMPTISKFKQFKGGRRNSKVATTFYIQSR